MTEKQGSRKVVRLEDVMSEDRDLLKHLVQEALHATSSAPAESPQTVALTAETELLLYIRQ